MITAQQAYDDLRNYKKDISDIDLEVFLSWLNYINNFVYRAFVGVIPSQVSSSYALTTSPNVDTYALPSDFRSMNTWGTGVWKSDGTDQISQDLPVTMPGSNLEGYFISGNNIVFTPKPTNTTKYFVYYIPKLAKLTAMSDDTIIEDEYLEFLTKALDVKYTQWDEGKGDEGFADARFVRCLDELLDNVLKSPSVYALPDYSVNY